MIGRRRLIFLEGIDGEGPMEARQGSRAAERARFEPRERGSASLPLRAPHRAMAGGWNLALAIQPVARERAAWQPARATPSARRLRECTSSRSDSRRVGTDCVRPFLSLCSPYL